MSDERIVVAGAGPVGLAFACACTAARAHVIEPAARMEPPVDAYDVRIFALSAGTRSFLRDIGAWERLDSARLSPVRRMEVFGDRGSRLAFSGRPGVPLAWIVEAGRLTRALEEQAASIDAVTVSRGAEVAQVDAAAAGVVIGLGDGTRLEADLLVGADGPDSKVRSLLGLPVEVHPYGESALVANFEVEQEHAGVARQWFGAHGVLAWLPLPGRRISIVWSAPANMATEAAALPADEFERRVRDLGQRALGELRLESRVASFPLRRVHVERIVCPGVALAGDAAHAIHPLAGQGVNLGFQDARTLAGVLSDRSPLERAGDLRVLRRYARERREDVSAMQFVTDGLDRLFSLGTPGASWVRNLGLDLADGQDWAKSALVQRAVR